jgi:hypothetical protein
MGSVVMPLAQSTAAPATVYSESCEPDTCLDTFNDGAEGFIIGNQYFGISYLDPLPQSPLLGN